MGLKEWSSVLLAMLPHLPLNIFDLSSPPSG